MEQYAQYKKRPIMGATGKTGKKLFGYHQNDVYYNQEKIVTYHLTTWKAVVDLGKLI